MKRIRLLSEQVANQIAAGEVIERPASAVKELVENALDAHARRIEVEIEAGGRSLIRVSDDGIGMNRDDVLLCLERHATSKIQSADDLHAVMSLGFRGEALPSLASVSRFTLTSREHDPAVVDATQVIIHGGKMIAVKSAGAPPGTCVEARQLFFNLPARRKFLRSEDTERAHIQHYLTLAALAYPEVAFGFIQDHRLVWQLPALKTEPSGRPALSALKERLRALYGSSEGLLPVDFSATLAPSDTPECAANESLRVWGFLGAPGMSRSTRDNQHLFVNRRPVENRGLNFALLEGYHTALMKGRYPVCCLFVEVSPAEVDVNVHPAKREVKFRHEKAVRNLVVQAVREVLLAFHAPPHSRPAVAPSPSADFNPPSTTAVRPSAEQSPLPLSPAPLAPASAPAPDKPEEPRTPVPAKSVFNGASRTALAAPPATLGQSEGKPETAPGAFNTAPQVKPPSSPAAQEAAADSGTALLSVPLRLVGSIGRLYVVLESDRGRRGSNGGPGMRRRM
ncbi:MAG: DNA mismatch repair endonuclease MutL, partial [Candidatus Omnitrophica bacterium]|nr:DNA mismatch repair endonuclease MutL [Candidatus Omnitrophota bacterium]